MMIYDVSGSIKVELWFMPMAHEICKILEDIFYSCEHLCIPVCDWLLLSWNFYYLRLWCYIKFDVYKVIIGVKECSHKSKLKQTPQREDQTEELKSKTSTSEQDLDSRPLGDFDDSDGHSGTLRIKVI